MISYLLRCVTSKKNFVASVPTAESIPPRKDPDFVAKKYAENGRIPSFSEKFKR